MALSKLAPVCKDYIWGGDKLIREFNKSSDREKIAETWEISCHRDGLCTIVEGAGAGESLRDYINRKGKAILGKNCDKYDDFPILVKFIDARDNLSVQVHPSDEYAMKHEGQLGKTEYKGEDEP